MPKPRILVFTACYNERDNIGPLIDQIVEALPVADVLVLDDNSPDGTWEIIQTRANRYSQLRAVMRPRKLGIGSAHKYALLYAIREGYETLITMDADFSHDPKQLPDLLRPHGKNSFVTGSRYCAGGSSAYLGYRNIVSRLGNFAARLVLGVKLRELTTYYRVFDVNSLRALPLHRLNATGYSYGIQLIYYLQQTNIGLREVPIHFAERKHGISKISKIEILWSAFDVIKLALERMRSARDLEPDPFVSDACSNCGDRVLAMKYRAMQAPASASNQTVDTYQCSSVIGSSHPPVYSCLRCGLLQVPDSFIPSDLENRYRMMTDAEYLKRFDVRSRTFRKALSQIQNTLPAQGSILEIGAFCGLFMKEAESQGWQVDGVEPSRWAVCSARDKLGVKVHAGYLAENRNKLRPKYDAVVFWDVLEHVRDPVQFLRDCADFLEPGSVLCFSTLNVGNWFPRLLGQRWPWFIDMHLHYFDREVIKDLLHRAGFELIDTQPYTHYAPAHYALRSAKRVLPRPLRKLADTLTHVIPNNLILPFAFGDIVLYVARKLSPSVSHSRPFFGSDVYVHRTST